MAEPSIFSPGGSGTTRGGLDRYLAPAAGDSSSMPPAIEDEKVDPEASERELDCAGADANEAVCQIAKAEEEERQMGSEGT